MRRYPKEGALSPDGKLKEQYRPAVYFETSVIVDYWSAEGLEMRSLLPKEIQPHEKYDEAIKSLFRYNKRLDAMGEVRELILLGKSSLTAVTTPLAVLELFEWHAHAAFKQISSNAAGVICVDRMSRKQIGDYLARIWKEGHEEAEAVADNYDASKAPKTAIMNNCLLNLSFMEFHGLDGVLDVDLINFNIDAGGYGSSLSVMAYHQIGLADLMHVAAANHLGCKYLASFDSDFQRCSEIIHEEFGLTVIPDVQQLLSVMKKEA